MTEQKGQSLELHSPTASNASEVAGGRILGCNRSHLASAHQIGIWRAKPLPKLLGRVHQVYMPSLLRGFPLLRITALALAALVIGGYHMGVEDAEIYVPAARKSFDPNLYPFGTGFFMSHAQLSIFGPLLGASAKLTHLSMDWTIFTWYLITLVAVLASAWSFLRTCFSSQRACWTAMLLATAVLTMPATNTGLLLMDPYLTARSFSTPLTMFAVSMLLQHRYACTVIAVMLTALIHPQMAAYISLLLGITWATECARPALKGVSVASASGVVFMPTGFHIAPADGPYREALLSRDYFFLCSWTWYHWLGMLAPMAILFWFSRANLRGIRDGFRPVCLALVSMGICSIIAAGFLCSPNLEMYARLQPLRSFHLITLVFVLLFSGIVGEYLLRESKWSALALFFSLGICMFWVSRATYPNTQQIELPSNTSKNPWVNTLLWIRSNTPRDAVFAVDSGYFVDTPMDLHGFRAISERSALADYVKDGGVVTLFPELAYEWKKMSDSTHGLNHFSIAEFQSLRQKYPEVSWTVVHGAAPSELNCPYKKDGFSVCWMPGALQN